MQEGAHTVSSMQTACGTRLQEDKTEEEVIKVKTSKNEHLYHRRAWQQELRDSGSAVESNNSVAVFLQIVEAARQKTSDQAAS